MQVSLSHISLLADPSLSQQQVSGQDHNVYRHLGHLLFLSHAIS